MPGMELLLKFDWLVGPLGKGMMVSGMLHLAGSK